MSTDDTGGEATAQHTPPRAAKAGAHPADRVEHPAATATTEPEKPARRSWYRRIANGGRLRWPNRLVRPALTVMLSGLVAVLASSSLLSVGAPAIPENPIEYWITATEPLELAEEGEQPADFSAAGDRPDHQVRVEYAPGPECANGWGGCDSTAITVAITMAGTTVWALQVTSGETSPLDWTHVETTMTLDGAETVLPPAGLYRAPVFMHQTATGRLVLSGQSHPVGDSFHTVRVRAIAPFPVARYGNDYLAAAFGHVTPPRLSLGELWAGSEATPAPPGGPLPGDDAALRAVCGVVDGSERPSLCELDRGVWSAQDTPTVVQAIMTGPAVYSVQTTNGSVLPGSSPAGTGFGLESRRSTGDPAPASDWVIADAASGETSRSRRGVLAGLILGACGSLIVDSVRRIVFDKTRPVRALG